MGYCRTRSRDALMARYLGTLIPCLHGEPGLRVALRSAMQHLTMATPKTRSQFAVRFDVSETGNHRLFELYPAVRQHG